MHLGAVLRPTGAGIQVPGVLVHMLVRRETEVWAGVHHASGTSVPPGLAHAVSMPCRAVCRSKSTVVLTRTKAKVVQL